MVLVHTALKRHQMSTSHDSSTRVGRQDVDVQKENMHKETLKKFDGGRFACDVDRYGLTLGVLRREGGKSYGYTVLE